MKTAVAIIFGVLMILAGINHALNPKFYRLIMPPLLPPTLVHAVALILEVAIGVLLLIPHTRQWGALAFMVLMILFMPLHIWDLFKDQSVTGSFIGSVIRLLIQFVLIYAGYWLATPLLR